MKIVVYGATWCGHCDVVKSLLEKEGVPYEYVDIDDNEDIVESKNLFNIPFVEFYRDTESTPFLSVEGTLDKDQLEEIIKEK